MRQGWLTTETSIVEFRKKGLFSVIKGGFFKVSPQIFLGLFLFHPHMHVVYPPHQKTGNCYLSVLSVCTDCTVVKMGIFLNYFSSFRKNELIPWSDLYSLLERCVVLVWSSNRIYKNDSKASIEGVNVFFNFLKLWLCQIPSCFALFQSYFMRKILIVPV